MSVISGEELRQIRENADRSVEQFALALGLSVEDYLDLETGRVALTDAQERAAYDAWDDSAEEGGYPIYR